MVRQAVGMQLEAGGREEVGREAGGGWKQGGKMESGWKKGGITTITGNKCKRVDRRKYVEAGDLKMNE